MCIGMVRSGRGGKGGEGEDEDDEADDDDDEEGNDDETTVAVVKVERGTGVEDEEETVVGKGSGTNGRGRELCFVLVVLGGAGGDVYCTVPWVPDCMYKYGECGVQRYNRCVGSSGHVERDNLIRNCARRRGTGRATLHGAAGAICKTGMIDSG